MVTLLAFLAPAAVQASNPSNPGPPPPALSGTVADQSGAIVPGAEVDLLNSDGSVAVTNRSDPDGAFKVVAPHAGSFTLVVSEAGFETVRTPVVIPAASLSAVSSAAVPPAAPVRIVLPIAQFSTNVRVNAENGEDLTAPDENRDSSVMTSSDLKALPIFDNDYASAMSAFLDQNVGDTGGTGLMVDGVEANRATVSASAVQEIRINQDPYSAQYYYPGRGQMEIVTKSAAEHYHGQFNFLYRNSALNAQNALAPTKPFEQRQNYEGHITGPIWHAQKSSFLASFNRVLYDQDSVISATIEPTPANPIGAFQANVAAP
ncbi:MAG: carboxypeptidase-like regulatory domain-containing protein, partial [Terracidiphilus sp.]